MTVRSQSQQAHYTQLAGQPQETAWSLLWVLVVVHRVRERVCQSHAVHSVSK